MTGQCSVALADPAATEALGAALARGALAGRVLYLHGDLGAGKTTLVRGLLRALGYEGRVKSPSYSLVELYEFSRLNLYHFDFYRFANPNEWLNSGFREHFNSSAVCVVEWPERAEGLLPTPDLDLRLDYADPGRRATLAARTAAGAEWLAGCSGHLPCS